MRLNEILLEIMHEINLRIMSKITFNIWHILIKLCILARLCLHVKLVMPVCF